jgi:hypothetical protein
MLGAFAQSQKATISFIVPVYPSARMEHLSSHRTDFNEILYWGTFTTTYRQISSLIQTVQQFRALTVCRVLTATSVAQEDKKCRRLQF